MPTATNPSPGLVRRPRQRWPVPFLALAGALTLIASMSTATAAATSQSVTSQSATAANPSPTLTPEVSEAVKHDTSPALRNLAPVPAPQQDAKIEEVPLHQVPRQVDPEAATGSAKAQRDVVANTMPDFEQNFEGVGNVNGVLPPDTQGDVGKDHYVQMINLSFAIWDKQGDLLYGPVPNTTLWQGFGGPCETFNGGDPITGAIGGKLYVSGGWDTSGNPLANTGVYDPAADSWQTVASNPAPRAAPGAAVADDMLYLVGGCATSACAPSNSVVRYDPVADSWDTLAPYPHTISWQSCAGIDGKVYCAGGLASGTTYTDGYVYDPAANSWSAIAAMPANLWGSAYAGANGLLIISSGLSGPSQLTNAGYAYDPQADSWSDIPNAQFPRFRGGGSCGFYKVGGSSVAGFSPTPQSEHLSELDQCGVTDVPWLAADPTTATLQPGGSVTVTTTLTATPEVEVAQPGTYTAQLSIKSNSPYRVDPIDIAMTVTPPKGWGKIAGTVTGTDCTGDTAPLQNVQVQASGRSYTFSLKTDGEGLYAFWAPAASNPFTLIASKDGWISQTKQVNIKTGKTTTVTFTLHALCG